MSQAYGPPPPVIRRVLTYAFLYYLVLSISTEKLNANNTLLSSPLRLQTNYIITFRIAFS
jgi:hypothetical protein